MYLSRRGSILTIHTPAKLNLFLEILSRRPDGFHELETLIAPVNLFDTLTLIEDNERLRLSTTWSSGIRARRRGPAQSVVRDTFSDLPPEEDDLAMRAAMRLREDARERRGVRMTLVKRIPAAAGLGGASSDAAAVLVGLNELWNLGYSRQRLSQVGAELGSDVPCFLTPGASFCSGRGESVEYVGLGGRIHFVVVKPPVGLSTAAVYRECRVPERPLDVAELRRAVERADAAEVGRRLHNRLQEAAEQLSPWVRRLRRQFDRLSCLGHQLSGSGSSYFGVMPNARAARRAAGRLRASGLDGTVSVATIQAPCRHSESVRRP